MDRADAQAQKMKNPEEPDFFQKYNLDPQAVYTGVIFGLITLALIFVFTRKRSRGSTLLICGPCESGKTCLFGQLLHKKQLETYTSAKENKGHLSVPGRAPLPVVDVPGHERLRVKYLEEYKNQVKAIIYVVDSSTLQKQLRDTAEYLFNIITNPIIYTKRPKIMVVCNKQDLSLAKGQNVIQKELEKEMELLRGTHSRTLQETNDQNVERVEIGQDGEEFQFRHLPMKVEFCELSAQSSETMDSLRKWAYGLA
ncbi:hypothetical protein TCAL_08331 [Tigriopus californicus]|uniref:Signal recognition particle receptor subunit beta n=1 Tax=Tigriopus californicus TaxID=6832 RepID=A0A553PNB6_TIGCA|nr:signal recognition particle receptor subunit beta-like [Tigriopus californicus]TRY79164.1 hypothetical protein TCAL_08331 [Tigriopus californicus]